MRGELGKPATGFTLIELLVVVTIILVLIGLLMTSLASAHRERQRVLAATQVKDIRAAAEAYYMVMHQYPPDTGTVDAAGNTTPFTTDDPAEADSIYMYLGRKVYEVETSTKHGLFLPIQPYYLKTFGSKDNIMVDPWGKPYRMDCIHVKLEPGAPVSSPKTNYAAPELGITPVGAPYNSSVPKEKQLVPVKVWSSGPDMLEGSMPSSQVETITNPADQDNIESWRN